MKKTLTVNLGGIVFHIDEDAYQLLDNYLSNLRVLFGREEGKEEIMNDFEARISELLNDRVRMGFLVITIEHVEDVIKRMGKPEQIFQEEEHEDNENRSTSEPMESAEKTKKRLMRDPNNRMLGGIASGLALYLNIDVVLVRLLLIGLLFIGFPFIIILYLILWMVIPEAKTAADQLIMRGKHVNLENIGKTVTAESTSVAYKEQKGCLAGFIDLFVSFLKVGIAGLGCLIGLPLLFALFIVLIVLFAVLLGVGGGLIGAGGGLLGILPSFLVVKHPVLATIAVILLIGIPVFAIIYAIIAHFTKVKPLNRSINWALLSVWFLSFIMFFFSGFKINRIEWATNKTWWPDAIIGNGLPVQKTFDLDGAFTWLEIDDYIAANIQIEQIPFDAQATLEISGDENLVEQVRFNVYDGRLTLSSLNRFRGKNNLTINLHVNDLKSIQAGFIGNIRMNSAFIGNEMEVIMKGIGNFYADSLYANSLIVRTEGVGSATVSGKANKTSLETSGTGNINAMELQSDTVYAQVNGIGAIQCNPVDFFEGRVYGIGSITYKEEPKQKDVGTFGVGKIKKR